MNLARAQWIVNAWCRLNPKPGATDYERVMSLAADELFARGQPSLCETADAVAVAIARTLEVNDADERLTAVGLRAYELAAAQVLRRIEAQVVGSRVLSQMSAELAQVRGEGLPSLQRG